MDQNKGNIMILAVIGIAVLAVGFFSGQIVQKSADKNIWDQAVKEIFGTVGGGIIANNFSGKITGISFDKKSISVEVNSPISGVNLPKDYKIKTVLITGDTKFISQTQKDPAEFGKEMAAFSAKMGNIKPGAAAQPITPPSPIVQKDITVNDLKTGNQISFSFKPKEGLNILDNQFTATQIYVNNLQAVNAVPAAASVKQ